MKLLSFSKPSSSFASNVLKLATGSALAQGISILTTPIITRLFSPEAYGIAAIFASMTSIIGVIACLRYELAIMLPRTSEEAAQVLVIALISTIFMSLFCILLILVGGDTILHLIKITELKNYLFLIPLSVFFLGSSLALNYWNSRVKQFGRLSIVQVISSAISRAFTLGAGFAGYVSGGVLILTSMLGSMITAGSLAQYVWRNDKQLFLNNVRMLHIKRVLTRYKKFPLIDTWGGLLNSISWQLPALMLSSFFSASVVGYYALGITVIKTPLSMVSGAVSQVFFQKGCENKNLQGSNAALVENLMDRLMFICILPTIVLSFVGEELFTIVFGTRWAEAGRYTQILAPWMFFWFISSPLSTLFLVYEKQGAALSVHSMIFLTRILSLYIGGVYNSIYLALSLFSASGVIAYAFVAAWNIRLAKASGKTILSTFFKYIFFSFPVCLCLFVVKYLFRCSIMIIFLSALLMVSIYLIVFWKQLILKFVDATSSVSRTNK